ncbi:hypothetical protein B0T24DRAFT_681705 [Lasiosphaeria ovina]|uniref:Nephrocystin 3-like N-terminal domain-containing protein n=1 Tax=Lasiosphaeria ovina TaxID=92902 RepID=A0AAE0K402_9PEZI|nr:hypothetical protein B0T24DRAFT_681705 [Lasiosphaeria ovina]
MEDYRHCATPSQPLRNMMLDPEELKIYHEYGEVDGASIHPAMGVSTKFDDQCFVLEAPSVWTELRDVIIASQALGIGKDVNIDNCTWSDVRQCRYAAEEAIAKGKNDYALKAIKNPVRRVFRHGATAADLGRFATGFIPDEKGLNVLRAGLAMLFTFLEAREKNRERIFETFEDIEGILLGAQERLHDFRRDIKIRREVLLLFQTLFQEIPTLLKTLNHEQTLKFGPIHFFSPPQREAEAIEEAIKKVNSARQSLNEAILDHASLKVAESSRTMSEIDREVKATRQTAHSMYSTMREQDSHVNNKLDKLNDSVVDEIKSLKAQAGLAIDEILRECRRLVSKVQRPILVGVINTGVYQNGLEFQHTRDALGISNIYTRTLTPAHPPPPPINQLLYAIDGHPLGATRDLRCVLRQGNTMEEEALGRGRWLLTTPRFQAWLRSETSDFIFADGDGGSTVHAKTSPLTVFCATFSAAMRTMPASMPLTFFCGQHSTDDDPLRGPEGVLRSLIAQLIAFPCTPVLDTRNLDARRVREAADGDVPSLAALLHALVAQLDSRITVWCLVDGISELEGTLDEWDDEVDELILGFLDIVEDDKLRPRLKVVMTSATRSLRLTSLVPEDEHISLQAGNVYYRSMVKGAFLDDIQGVLDSSDSKARDESGTGPQILRGRGSALY